MFNHVSLKHRDDTVEETLEEYLSRERALHSFYKYTRRAKLQWRGRKRSQGFEDIRSIGNS